MPDVDQRVLHAIEQLRPAWVQVAVHELGHWLAWKDLPRARVVHIRVWGSNRNPQGEVEMDWSRTDSDCDKGYLIGLLAGEEADKLWERATGIPRMRGGCSHDMSAFHRARRQHEPSRQWSESHLRSAARDLLTSRWRELVRRVPRLAEKGRL